MTLFSELGELLSPEAVSDLEARIAQHVPPAEPVTVERDAFKRAHELARSADNAMPYMDASVSGTATQFATLLRDSILELRDQTSTAFATRAAGVAKLQDVYANLQRFTGTLAPFAYVANADVDAVMQEISNSRAELKKSASELEALKEETRAALVGAREAAAERGTSALSREFDALANEHDGAARKWLWATGFSALLLGFVTVWLVASLDGAQDAAGVVRLALSKLSAVAVLGYALFFCVRNYRSHRHLSTEYRARATILTVAQALRSGVEDPAAQSTILQTAVLAALSVPRSGLVKHDGEDDSSTLALIATLTARSSRESTPG